MNDAERQRIIEAGRRHAVESARAQGLPDTITDPDVLRQIATIVVAHRADKAARAEVEHVGGEHAAADIAAERRVEQQDVKAHDEAVAAVQRFLPDFVGSPEWMQPMLVFSPEQALDLLARSGGRPKG